MVEYRIYLLSRYLCQEPFVTRTKTTTKTETNTKTHIKTETNPKFLEVERGSRHD